MKYSIVMLTLMLAIPAYGKGYHKKAKVYFESYDDQQMIVCGNKYADKSDIIATAEERCSEGNEPIILGLKSNAQGLAFRPSHACYIVQCKDVFISNLTKKNLAKK